MIRVLAGDVGAARTTLSLLEGDALTGLRSTERVVCENNVFSGLVAMVGDFMHGARVDAAAFAAPGFVSLGSVALGEAAWPIERAPLCSVLGTERCAVLSQAEAALLGVPQAADQLRWLQAGTPDPAAPRALVYLGERYGRAFALADGAPLPTDASHIGFAPRNAIERRLLSRLSEHSDHVSLSDVLAEGCLMRLFHLLLAESLAPPSAQAEVERAPDPDAAIARLGLRDLDDACAAAVAFYADLLGVELCNVALSYLPRGGLFVAGSMVSRLFSLLEQGPLLEAFLDRDSLGKRLESIPLALIDDAELVLHGTQEAAIRLLRD